MGYTYQRVSASQTLLAKESKEMTEYRESYLQAITTARENREVVYLDESYVNQRHQANRCWVNSESKVKYLDYLLVYITKTFKHFL